MTTPGTFDRVYAAIRQRLREGLYRPGSRLEPAVLGDELNASVTPVRDALHRLTGERLLEAPRQEGFRVPVLTENLLRQLYAWHLDLLLIAVMKKQAHRIAGSSCKSDLDRPVHERQNELFMALVCRTGNSEHAAILQALMYRLEPVQRLESSFLDQTEAETRDIVDAIEAWDRRSLRKSLAQYHRRREQIVPDLIAKLLQD